jgi:hypothetical protein
VGGGVLRLPKGLDIQALASNAGFERSMCNAALAVRLATPSRAARPRVQLLGVGGAAPGPWRSVHAQTSGAAWPRCHGCDMRVWAMSSRFMLHDLCPAVLDHFIAQCVSSVEQ